MSKDKTKKKSKENKIKVTSSVEKNMVDIATAVINIYEIKTAELKCKAMKIDDNSDKNKENLRIIQEKLRETLNEFHYLAKALFENPEYTGRQVKTNYLEEFTGKEPTPTRRYTYFDMEMLLREDYLFCKNAPVRKVLRKMNKAKTKFWRYSNNFTKKTNMKYMLVNMK